MAIDAVTSPAWRAETEVAESGIAESGIARSEIARSEIAEPISVAPYAVVRVSALAPRAEPDLVRAFRRDGTRLVELHRWCTEQAEPLTELLHAQAGAGGAADGPRRALVSLRRDVHNGRSPRPALRAALTAVPDLPVLAHRWLQVRAEMDELIAARTDQAPLVLAAERVALAELCQAEPLRQAVATISDNLLRAVSRTAQRRGAPDDRVRRSEPTVLRYVLRATTRTTPLSWFTEVGWGRWAAGDGAPAGLGNRWPASAGTARVLAAATPDRHLVDRLVALLTAHPALTAALDHRVAPGLRVDGAQVRFRRTAHTDNPKIIVPEQDVAVPLTGPLRLVLDHVTGRPAGAGVPVARLTAALAARMAGPSAAASTVAARYVDSLVRAGLLRPCSPVDPQHPDVLAALMAWLTAACDSSVDPAAPSAAAAGLPVAAAGVPAVAELAELLTDIDRRTRGYASTPASRRPAALAALRAQWGAVLAAAASSGSSGPSGPSGPARLDGRLAAVGGSEPAQTAPLTEDVTIDGVLTLGERHGLHARADLARLAPLFEIFDRYSLLRRAARDLFVDRYGVGGTCENVVAFGAEYAHLWERATNAELEGLRADLGQLARAGADAGAGAGSEMELSEVELSDQLLDEAARRLPVWLRRRPASYAVFAQPLTTGRGTGLCVNSVHGGWGRFTSRFLGAFGARARDAVAEQVRWALGPDASAAQLRPVCGFNANLHPMLGDRPADRHLVDPVDPGDPGDRPGASRPLVVAEVSDDPAWGDVHTDQLCLVHDPRRDQIRVRHRATGTDLDLLYLGFLQPLALADRLLPLVTDLGCGQVELADVLSPAVRVETALGAFTHQRRLRYRDVVLSRARWNVPAAMSRAWADELAAEPGHGIWTVPRWRSVLNLPEQVVLIAAGDTDVAGGDLPKPQFVDLGSVLHARTLGRLLARHPGGVVIEEALPAPAAGERAVEIVAETYRRAL
ncbi:hypothetical protein CcI49_14820 [Frankia sp. CcI49]|uniref:lantibiotic dehydratase n=1 Tax=Frankia sp. CcI49 TaxID=1745382 RepID=UPI000975E2F0|nr:lantibiotic dehydratase [Frankia sp. CcI49]ONH59977.1 hypothetical protein CcI49_14820 [Frankia sp. CcI49]